jgi:hypothetical protein
VQDRRDREGSGEPPTIPAVAGERLSRRHDEGENRRVCRRDEPG